MKIILVFSILFFQPLVFAEKQEQKCQSLADDTRIFMRNMNAAFRTNYNLILEEKIKVQEYSPDPKIKPPISFRAPNKRDVVSSDKKVFIPHPCFASDFSQYSREEFLFWAAHEFSHLLLDNDTTCEQDFNQLIIHENLNTHQLDRISDLQHINIDIMALKILSHLNVNQTVALNHQHSTLRQVMHDHPSFTEAYSERIKITGSIIPTSFDQGNDFIPYGYGEFGKVSHFIHQHYPSSSFFKDIGMNQHNPDKCRIFPLHETNKTIIDRQEPLITTQ